MELFFDADQGTAVFVGYFENEEKLRAADEVLAGMDASDTPGTRPRSTSARSRHSARSAMSRGVARSAHRCRIEELGDWRGETLSRVRALIKEADPDVVEEWKWRGVPVWEHDGMICTGETYKGVVKLTFAKGASLDDPSGLFNSSLDGNVRRAIDIREGEAIDEDAFKALIREAVSLNES